MIEIVSSDSPEFRNDTPQLKAKIAELRADLKQGHACNACLKDQLENGKHECCVSPDSCDVDGIILQLRAELADKIGEIDAECRVSQFATKEVGNLQAEVKRLEGIISKVHERSYPGLAVKEGKLLNEIYKMTWEGE